MLVGTYSYNGHNYGVQAYDFGDSITAFLIPESLKDKQYLDKGIHGLGIDTGAQWDKLFVKVGIGAVYASCYIIEEEDDNGKPVKLKNELNVDCIKKFGSVLRGMKDSCNRNKVTDDLFESFNPTKVLRYKFESGYMDLEIRVIRKVEYRKEGVFLKLKEDYSYETKIYQSTNVNHKYALDLSEFVKKPDDSDWDDFNDIGNDRVFSLKEIIDANPDKSYSWLWGRKYHVVKDIKEMEKVCKEIWNHKGVVAFDTETTGLKVNVTSRQGIGDKLVGFIFCIKPGEAWYFPFKHKLFKNLCTEAEEASLINKYFKPILEEKDILCHNGAYDWKVMYNYGISTNVVHDTLILFKVTMWNDHRDMPLNLKDLTKTFLGRDSFKLSDFVKGRFGENNIRFWDLDEESTKYYACPDTDNLLELYYWCVDNGLLAKYGAKKVYQIETNFSIVIAYQEYYGHCVDMSRIGALVDDIQNTKKSEYQAMVNMVGHDFNPRSNKELPKILFEELGYPILKYTATGNPSCDKRTRAKMMEEKDENGNLKYPFINHLARYLDSCTLESNFTKNIGKFATEDGLMFSEVQQFLETGRVSVSNPNYQSYSDVVKHYIIPRNGYFALDADYSSVEARIMVSMAGCRDMVERMKDPDTDYHTIKASQMFGIPYELVTHKQRKMSKGVNFGILYGLGDPNLGVNLYGSKTPENTRKAKKQKELYFKGMEELKTFIDVSKMQGTTQHYSTTYFGRRRYFDPRRVRTDTIERQSCNARIQGTAADIYKVAMVRLFHQIRKRDWMGKVLISAFVHDECFLEVSKSLDPIVVLGVLRKCMMLDNKGWCPLFIGAGYGENWYEAKNTEIPIQVQESLIEEYGETGLDWWNGDTKKLCSWIVDRINLYGRDRVLTYLKDEENKGKVLPPAVNSLAHGVIEAILDGADIEGCVTKDIHECDDVLDNLHQFGIAFGCVELVDSADVKRPAHTETKEAESGESEGDSLDDEYTEEETSWRDTMNMYINTVGVYFKRVSGDDGEDSDGTNRYGIYFRYDVNNKPGNSFIYAFVNKHKGDTPLYAVIDGEEKDTGILVDKKIYPDLVKIFATLKR